MSWITARRRHPLAGYVVVLLALSAFGVLYAAVAGSASARADVAAGAPAPEDVAAGRQLFLQNCSSCHGLNAEGSGKAPSLIGVGAASVDFQVSTGRMPAQTQGVQMPRKEPIYNEDQVRQLAAYVSSLAPGPEIPTAEQVDYRDADVQLGLQLFMTNCAQCHNFAGSGGALTGGKYAPNLSRSTPTQIYEAMLTGPQAMPVFNDATITPDQKRAIIRYVVQTREEDNPGGLSLGRLGPVSEGLAGWLVGIGLMVGAALWITAKQRAR